MELAESPWCLSCWVNGAMSFVDVRVILLGLHVAMLQLCLGCDVRVCSLMDVGISHLLLLQ